MAADVLLRQESDEEDEEEDEGNGKAKKKKMTVMTMILGVAPPLCTSSRVLGLRSGKSSLNRMFR